MRCIMPTGEAPWKVFGAFKNKGIELGSVSVNYHASALDSL